jgi:hypothetical protein
MIILFLKNHILKNRTLMLREARVMHNFALLLIKLGNTRAKWTIDEISQIKSHMKHLALCMTVVIIFALPFGLLLLPLYTEFLDRREKRRINT